MTEDDFVREASAYLPRLRRLCASYCRAEEDRDDLLQDILVSAWRARESFRGDASFSTWLYRVALNVALQRARRQRARPQAVSLAPEHAMHFSTTPPPQVAEIDIDRAMSALNQVDRAVLALYLEDNTYAEIAAVLGSTPGAIGVRLTRIREQLREILRGERNGRT